jgi:hypothetical protein
MGEANFKQLQEVAGAVNTYYEQVTFYTHHVGNTTKGVAKSMYKQWVLPLGNFVKTVLDKVEHLNDKGEVDTDIGKNKNDGVGTNHDVKKPIF